MDMLAFLSLPFLLAARLVIAVNLTTYIEPSLRAASRLISTGGFMNELMCSIIARESVSAICFCCVWELGVRRRSSRHSHVFLSASAVQRGAGALDLPRTHPQVPDHPLRADRRLHHARLPDRVLHSTLVPAVRSGRGGAACSYSHRYRLRAHVHHFLPPSSFTFSSPVFWWLFPHTWRLAQQSSCNTCASAHAVLRCKHQLCICDSFHVLPFR